LVVIVPMKMEDVLKKLKPVLREERVDAVWQEYLLADSDMRKLIEQELRLQLAGKLGHGFEARQILLEPPPKDIAKGEYTLGTVCYGNEAFHPFELREEELIQHCGTWKKLDKISREGNIFLKLNYATKGWMPMVHENTRDVKLTRTVRGAG